MSLLICIFYFLSKLLRYLGKVTTFICVFIYFLKISALTRNVGENKLKAAGPQVLPKVIPQMKSERLY